MRPTDDVQHSRRMRMRAHLRNFRGARYGAKKTKLWSVVPYPTGSNAVFYPCEPHFICMRCGFYEAGHYCDDLPCKLCFIFRNMFNELVLQDLCRRCDVVIRRVSDRYTIALNESDDYDDIVQICILLALSRTSRRPRTTRSALRYSRQVSRAMGEQERMFVLNVWPNWDKHPEELLVIAKELWR
jgi:hypothetical protein